MSIQNICPCCSNSLLHHIGSHREYWFCRHCWSEMPIIELNQEVKQQQLVPIVNLSTSFSKFNQLDVGKLAAVGV